MSPRTTRLLFGAYILALLLPFIVIVVFSNHDIGVWLATGMCPGGPMDRPARPCGPVEFLLIVFLGGWAAFIVIPVLVAWWAACTGGLVAVMAYVRRRAGR